jgi:hypothetical protein
MSASPFAAVVFSAFEDRDDGPSLRSGGAAEIKAAVLQAIDQGTLVTAIQELFSIAGLFGQRCAEAAMKQLLDLIHELLPMLEREASLRGLETHQRAAREVASQKLAGTQSAMAAPRVGFSANRPWWALRAEDQKEREAPRPGPSQGRRKR